MYNDKQNKLMLEVVDLLHKADVLLQQAMGASDECYYIHTQIENAADDVLDAIRENNPEDIDAE
jgi:hypothetical protein